MKDESFTSYWDMRVGEQLSIGNGQMRLRVEEKSGRNARIRLEFRKPTTVEKVEPAMASFARQGLM